MIRNQGSNVLSFLAVSLSSGPAGGQVRARVPPNVTGKLYQAVEGGGAGFRPTVAFETGIRDLVRFLSSSSSSSSSARNEKNNNNNGRDDNNNNKDSERQR